MLLMKYRLIRNARIATVINLYETSFLNECTNIIKRKG